ncbi:MAG: NAD(P)-dependent oxidoreductase [Bacteroidota bacterium]
MKKKILVFGAAGFIGTYLISELIKQNFEVTASDISDIGEKYYSQKDVKYICIDINKEADFGLLNNELFDAVIHLAAVQPANVSINNYDPKSYIEVNVIGTLNILNYCKNSKSKKIIYASSHRNTQGLWADKNKVSEKDGRKLKYSGQYAMFSISESAAQDCVLHYNEQYGLQGIIFRLPPVYGFGPHTEIFMNGKPIKTGFQIFIDNAVAGKPLVVWGDSSKGRDIVYIKDVIDAFLIGITHNDASGLYNIASGKYLTLREEAETIADVFWQGTTAPMIEEDTQKENSIDSFVYDISKAKNELNWSPKYSFRDMLLDYKKELDDKRFEHLIAKREEIFKKG